MQNLKNGGEVLAMLLPCAVVHQYVVEEYQDKLLKILMKDSIHEGLEGGRSIRQAEGHDEELIVALMRSKSRLLNVNLMHLDLVVPCSQVQF